MRNWLFVLDACKAIRLLTEFGTLGQVYNIGSRDEHSIREIANMIHRFVVGLGGGADSVERSPEFVSIPDRPYNDQRYLIDSMKINVSLDICFSFGNANIIFYISANCWLAARYAIRSRFVTNCKMVFESRIRIEKPDRVVSIQVCICRTKYSRMVLF